MIFLIPSVLFIVLGTLVVKYEMVELLAGYNEKKVADKKGMARWCGFNLILMGIINITLLALFSVAQIGFSYVSFIYMAVIVILVVRTVIGCRRYEY
ncbi:MAG: DUF3784 domain-containing protein [Defluviitaleaceae bacterium]|nr:DUF3784 domain-containing protein [Defluviitaleaceae bacterium]